MKDKKLIRKLFVILFCINLAKPSYGDLYLQAPTASDEDFETTLSNSLNNQSFVDYYIKTFPLQKEIDHLHQLFDEAQTHLFQQNFKEAQTAYEKVIQKSLSQDWKPEERNLIQQSFLKLIELSGSPKEISYWFTAALQFHSDFEITKGQIPELFHQEFERIKSDLLKEKIAWSPNLAEQTVVIVNGEIMHMTKTSTLELTPGKKRLTILSNKSFPQSLIVEARSIHKIQLKQIPFLEGNCMEPTYNESPHVLDDIKILAFYSSQCIKKQEGGFWIPLPVTNISEYKINKTFNEIKFNENPTANEPVQKKKNYWGYIGLAALTILTSMALQPQTTKKIIVRRQE